MVKSENMNKSFAKSEATSPKAEPTGKFSSDIRNKITDGLSNYKNKIE